MILRAVAVLSFAALAIGLPGVIALMRAQSGDGSALPVMVAMLLALLVVAGLWLFADKIARLALVRPQDPSFDSDLDSVAWLGIAISAIGAWQLFDGVRSAASLVQKWMLLARMAEWEGAEQLTDFYPPAVSTVIQIALAVAFLLRGTGVARWFHRLRYGPAA